MDANRLAALACDTKRRLDWDRILVLRDSATGEATPWKWVENARNFAIYTKTERDVHAVLAVGTIKASAHEIAALLTASSTQEYARKMEALHGHDFTDATHQYNVEPLGPGIKSPSTDKDTSPTALSVRSLTFGKPSGGCRRASHDMWYHLHAEYEDRSAGHVEHILTTLRAQDGSRCEKPQSANIKFFRDGVIAGYRIDEQSKSSSHHRPLRNKRSRVASKSCRNKGVRQQSSSRVHFYAEVPQFSEPASSRGVCSERTTMQRLVQVAKNCHRLSLLIRRRRLGVQALAGRTRFLPPTNTSCSCCSTRVLVAKVCRVCGQGVCRDCSDKYERETDGSIETVRVCDPCLDHVESCAYSSLRANAVSPMAVDDPLATLSSSVLSSSLTVL